MNRSIRAQPARVILAHAYIEPLARRRARLAIAIPAEADNPPIHPQRAAVILSSAHRQKAPRRRRSLAELPRPPAQQYSLKIDPASVRVPRADRRKGAVGRIQLPLPIRAPTPNPAIQIQPTRVRAARADLGNCRIGNRMQRLPLWRITDRPAPPTSTHPTARDTMQGAFPDGSVIRSALSRWHSPEYLPKSSMHTREGNVDPSAIPLAVSATPRPDRTTGQPQVLQIQRARRSTQSLSEIDLAVTPPDIGPLELRARDDASLG